MISKLKYVFKLSSYTIDPKDETFVNSLAWYFDNIICIHQFAQNNIGIPHMISLCDQNNFLYKPQH
jgi:hypothetical protein